jgi:hypothetical protein
MLWDSTDGGIIGFFRKGLKEELTSSQNPKGEFVDLLRVQEVA